MNQKINPVVAVVLALAIAAVVGIVSLKKFGKPAGIQGKMPASAANPNGGGPPKPEGPASGANVAH